MFRRARVGRMVLVSIAGMLALSAGIGCSNTEKLAVNSKRSGGLWSLGVDSSAFKEGETIPAKYASVAGGGQNVSPAVSWNKGPEPTREYAVIIQDADSKGDLPAMHWLVYKIPPSVTSLAEGAASTMKFAQGKNFTGAVGYIGPTNKTGKPHRYYIQVFALSDPIQAPAGQNLATLGKEFEGFILAKGQLVGTYPMKN